MKKKKHKCKHITILLQKQIIASQKKKHILFFFLNLGPRGLTVSGELKTLH